MYLITHVLIRFNIIRAFRLLAQTAVLQCSHDKKKKKEKVIHSKYIATMVQFEVTSETALSLSFRGL